MFELSKLSQQNIFFKDKQTHILIKYIDPSIIRNGGRPKNSKMDQRNIVVHHHIHTHLNLLAVAKSLASVIAQLSLDLIQIDNTRSGRKRDVKKSKQKYGHYLTTNPPVHTDMLGKGFHIMV